MDEGLLKAIEAEEHTGNGETFINDWLDTQRSITEVMETVGNSADACMAYNARKAGLDPNRFVINENDDRDMPGLYVTAVSILSGEAKDDMAVFTYLYDDPESDSEITAAVFVSDGEIADDEVNFSVSAEIYRKDANGLTYGYDGESWFLMEN